MAMVVSVGYGWVQGVGEGGARVRVVVLAKVGWR